MTSSLVAVVDTNVVVSGVISAKPDSSPALILDGMRLGRFRFLLSPALLSEYREVLLRPKLRRLHGLRYGIIDQLLDRLSEHAIWPESAVAQESPPDPDDQHLWDLLSSRRDAVLVTGDKVLLANPPPGVSVMLPRAFLDKLDPREE